jgi:nitroreductase/dihydropteridine reductase
MTPATLAAKRYATKVFDPERRLAEEDFEQLRQVMRLAPSSVNSQPWHFIVASSVEGKTKLANAAAPMGTAMAYNHNKILHASHSVVFCAKQTIDDDYLTKLAEQESVDGRYSSPEARAQYETTRRSAVSLHREALNDVPIWTSHQLYLNIGACLMAAAQLGIDALPMEGIDSDGIDKAFDLSNQSLKAHAIVCFGYAAQEDFNAGVPKSRLAEHDIFTNI